jgi:WD40 repeat protein
MAYFTRLSWDQFSIAATSSYSAIFPPHLNPMTNLQPKMMDIQVGGVVHFQLTECKLTTPQQKASQHREVLAVRRLPVWLFILGTTTTNAAEPISTPPKSPAPAEIFQGLRDFYLKTARLARFQHTGEIISVAFSNAGDLIAAGGADKTVRFWKIDRGSR